MELAPQRDEVGRNLLNPEASSGQAITSAVMELAPQRDEVERNLLNPEASSGQAITSTVMELAPKKDKAGRNLLNIIGACYRTRKRATITQLC